MKKNLYLSMLCFLLLVLFTFTDAFCIFTTLQTQTLHATTGVSIQFAEDDRILSSHIASDAEDLPFIYREDSNIWWCQKGTPVVIDATITEGYLFEGWYHNDEKIADTLQANYVVEGYTILSAHLTPIGESEEPSDCTAFAIYSSDDNSLSFYKQSTLPNVGEIYHDKVVTAIYPDIENLNAATYKEVPWYTDYAKKIVMVDVVDSILPSSLAFWFYNFNNCSTFHLENMDTSKVSSMRYTFHSVGTTASSLILDLNHWDTSSLQDAHRTFQGAGKNADTLQIHIGNWNTSNVTDMSFMFYETGKNARIWTVEDLTTKVISNTADDSYLAWDVSNVQDMTAMFSCVGEGADEFTLDIHNWNISGVLVLSRMFNAFRRGKSGAIIELDVATKEVTLEDGTSYTAWDLSGYSGTFYYMFGYAGKEADTFITDLSGWDVSNVTDMQWTFMGAGQNAATFSLGDLSSWNTGNVTSMDSMFKYAGQSAQYHLDLSGWDVSKVTAYGGFAYGTGTNIINPNF